MSGGHSCVGRVRQGFGGHFVGVPTRMPTEDGVRRGVVKRCNSVACDFEK